MVGEADDVEIVADKEMQEDVLSSNMTSNEVRELIHSLMRKSSILDECRARICSAVSKAMAERTKMFNPSRGTLRTWATKCRPGMQASCPSAPRWWTVITRHTVRTLG